MSKLTWEQVEVLRNGGADILPQDSGELREPKENKDAYETPLPFPPDDSYLEEANKLGVW